MALDHLAIIKAYPSITTIDDSFVNYGLDKDGNKIYFTQSNVDAARATLNAEAAAVKYKTDRTRNGSTIYPAIGDQLDLLWHAIDADSDLKVKFSAFYNSIKEVKDANPKP